MLPFTRASVRVVCSERDGRRPPGRVVCPGPAHEPECARAKWAGLLARLKLPQHEAAALQPTSAALHGAADSPLSDAALAEGRLLLWCFDAKMGLPQVQVSPGDCVIPACMCGLRACGGMPV